MPARRAVSPRRIEPASRPNNARRPARNEYELRPSANSSAKAPIEDMGGNPLVFFQINGLNAISQPPGSARRNRNFRLCKREAMDNFESVRAGYFDFSSG